MSNVNLTLPVQRQPISDQAGMVTVPWYRYFQNSQSSYNPLLSIPNGTLLGNDSGQAGAPSSINIGEGLQLVNGELSSTVVGGTVTSVGLSMPVVFNVGNSPITQQGTFSVTLASQVANTFWGAPNGSAGQPGFRLLVDADLPAQPASTLLGNPLASSHTPSPITLGANLSLSTGGVLSASSADPAYIWMLT